MKYKLPENKSPFKIVEFSQYGDLVLSNEDETLSLFLSRSGNISIYEQTRQKYDSSLLIEYPNHAHDYVRTIVEKYLAPSKE